MRGELDGDAHDRLRGGLESSDLSSRASLHFYDDDDDTERLDNSFHRHSKRSSRDQMQHSQKSSFASSQFTSPRLHQNKKDSTQLNQDLRLPLRALSQQETFRSPRSKMSDVPEAWLVFANNSNEQGGGRGAAQGIGFGTERAVPVNLANSIGSRLQVRSTTKCLTIKVTPIHTIVNRAVDINNVGLSRQALPT